MNMYKRSLLLIIIFIGCTHSCKFCSIGYTAVSPAHIKELLDQILKKQNPDKAEIIAALNFLRYLQEQGDSALSEFYEHEYLRLVYQSMEGTDEETRSFCS